MLADAVELEVEEGAVELLLDEEAVAGERLDEKEVAFVNVGGIHIAVIGAEFLDGFVDDEGVARVVPGAGIA